MTTETDFSKVAFITGTNSGIGRSLTLEFNRRKIKVYASDIKFDKETLELYSSLGNIIIDTFDVTSLQDIIRVRNKIALAENKVDYLYCNAGIVQVSHAVDITDEQLEKIYNINLFANIKIVREFVRLVINAKGTIIFSGSITKFLPLHSNSLYVSTKAALDQYAQVLQLELRGYGVKVINILGGYIKTNIFDSNVVNVPKGSIYDFDEYKQIYSQRVENLNQSSQNAMSCEEFAKRTLDKIENSNLNQVNIFEGTKSRSLYYISWLLPKWKLFDYMLNIFKLNFDYRKHLENDQLDISFYKSQV
ncbi:hypothetical protein WICMUC_000631 [Wickerhamomyces mucosus]|uniref:Uncharacterized protein n=1 Tax=Wickerhamomyces mucosus TaxID=1378264 RepID=A0A9P8PWT5_9ASCO|nr:hypothetical protein WICMUC_000631 [Wickerhamomyces mucosus]